MKRTSDDAGFFGLETKRSDRIKCCFSEKTAQENRTIWVATMKRFLSENDNDVVSKITLADNTIRNDPFYGFLGVGNQTVVSSLDKLVVTTTFAEAFLHRFFSTSITAVKDDWNTDIEQFEKAMVTLMRANEWPVWILFKAARFPASPAQWAQCIGEYLEKANLSVSVLYAEEMTTQVHYQVTAVGKILHNIVNMFQHPDKEERDAALFSSITARLQTNLDSRDQFFAELDKKLGVESLVFNPRQHLNQVLRAHRDAAAKKLETIPLRAPQILDADLLKYLSELSLEEPETVVRLFKREKLFTKLEFELLEENALKKMLASVENAPRLWGRDTIRLLNAHGKLNAWQRGSIPKEATSD
jgi:hypothetical protein